MIVVVSTTIYTRTGWCVAKIIDNTSKMSPTIGTMFRYDYESPVFKITESIYVTRQNLYECQARPVTLMYGDMTLSEACDLLRKTGWAVVDLRHTGQEADASSNEDTERIREAGKASGKHGVGLMAM